MSRTRIELATSRYHSLAPSAITYETDVITYYTNETTRDVTQLRLMYLF